MNTVKQMKSNVSVKLKVLGATLIAAGLVFSFSGQEAHASESLAKSKACLACHGVEKKVVGPAFKDVKAKYEKDAKAQAYLADKIKNGSKGVWGIMPMPKQNVTEDEAKALASWILGL